MYAVHTLVIAAIICVYTVYMSWSCDILQKQMSVRQTIIIATIISVGVLYMSPPILVGRMERCASCCIEIVNGVILGSTRVCQGCFLLEIQGTDYEKMLKEKELRSADFPEGMETLLRTSSSSRVHHNEPGAIQCLVYDLDGTGLRLHAVPAVFPASSAESMYALWHKHGIPLDYLRVNNPIASLKLCNWCGRKAKNKCKRCEKQNNGIHRARYCDSTCQAADWSRHKEFCSNVEKTDIKPKRT